MKPGSWWGLKLPWALGGIPLGFGVGETGDLNGLVFYGSNLKTG